MKLKSKTLVFLTTGILLLTNTSCTIARYSFTPAEQIFLDRPIAQDTTLRFNLRGYSPDRSVELGYAEPIQKGLVGASLFTEAILVTEIQESGTFVSIDIDRNPTKIFPSWNSAYIFLGVLTSYAIPYYGAWPGGGQPVWHWIYKLDVSYRLYIDGVEKAIYRYPLDEKVFRWILAPLVYPFLSHKEHYSAVLTSTARLFIRDAQRDGYW